MLLIEGYEKRQDDAGQILAHFTSYLGAAAGNWGKGKKPAKARELWKTREERAKDAERLKAQRRKQKRIADSAAGVVDINERRRAIAEFQKLGPPKLPPRKPTL
ncbi:MAG: hypothetical protein M3R38_08830 [Actinomycetota bacterium]|nr:hypothetical protein [Actinomycetota bacterium]